MNKFTFLKSDRSNIQTVVASGLLLVTISILDVLLNLKDLAIKLDGPAEAELKLDVKTPKTITASDLELPAGVEVMDPDHVIATLVEPKKLVMTLKVETGTGYVPSENNKNKNESHNGLNKIIVFYYCSVN